MCNCIEEKNKQLLEAGIYPGAESFNNLSVEMLTGKTFSRMEAVYPRKDGRLQPTHEFNLYHSFCPWCGAPYETTEAMRELDQAFVKLPLEMAMNCIDTNVILCTLDGIMGDIECAQKIRLTYYDKGAEESVPFFSIQAGEDTDRLDIDEYGICYYFMMRRKEFINQINLQKEKQRNG